MPSWRMPSRTVPSSSSTLVMPTSLLSSRGSCIWRMQRATVTRYSAQQLAVLLVNAGVRMVMLSACESGRRNGRMVWSGSALVLTRGEWIPAVVANQ